MKQTFFGICVRAVLLCGVGVLGFQLPARAQELVATPEPGIAAGTVKSGATVTVRIDNVGSTEVFGVILTFSASKGSKITYPGSCQLLRSGGSQTVQCMVGYITPGGSHEVSVDVGATKKGTYSVSAITECTAVACSANPLTIPVVIH